MLQGEHKLLLGLTCHPKSCWTSKSNGLQAHVIFMLMFRTLNSLHKKCFVLYEMLRLDCIARSVLRRLIRKIRHRGNDTGPSREPKIRRCSWQSASHPLARPMCMFLNVLSQILSCKIKINVKMLQKYFVLWSSFLRKGTRCS